MLAARLPVVHHGTNPETFEVRGSAGARVHPAVLGPGRGVHVAHEPQAGHPAAAERPALPRHAPALPGARLLMPRLAHESTMPYQHDYSSQCLALGMSAFYLSALL